MQWMLYVLAIFAGVLNAIQPGCNAALNKGLEMPFVAAMIVSAVTFSSLLIAGAFFGQIHWPSNARIAKFLGGGGSAALWARFISCPCCWWRSGSGPLSSSGSPSRPPSSPPWSSTISG